MVYARAKVGSGGGEGDGMRGVGEGTVEVVGGWEEGAV